jgi:shikimate dehydrogenase
MQNAALRAAGLVDWRYQLLPVAPELLAEVIKALPAAGFRGANVTIPHKQAALMLATDPTPRAHTIGAANTITFESGQLVADNTDAPALISSLPFEIAGGSALVLGAGGAARAAVWALNDAGAATVRVWSRTPARARELCEQLGGTPVRDAGAADLLVNCTSVGLDGSESLDGLPLATGELKGFGCVVDFVYADNDTALIRAARALGVASVEGLELLVRQGALSFERFTGLSAPVEAMRAAAGLYGAAS